MRLAAVLIETLKIKPGWQIQPTLRVTGRCDLHANAQESDGCAIGTKIPLVELTGLCSNPLWAPDLGKHDTKI